MKPRVVWGHLQCLSTARKMHSRPSYGSVFTICKFMLYNTSDYLIKFDTQMV